MDYLLIEKRAFDKLCNGITALTERISDLAAKVDRPARGI